MYQIISKYFRGALDGLEQNLPFRLEPFDEAVHGDLDHVGLAVAADAPLAVLHPPFRREVGGLCDVEAGVEPGVVTHWKGDHDFTFFLNNLEFKNNET